MTDQPMRTTMEEFERMVEFLQSEEAGRMTHDEIERFLFGRGEELTRLIYNEWLAKRAKSGKR